MVLGIDPGLASTGFGVVAPPRRAPGRARRRRHRHVARRRPRAPPGGRSTSASRRCWPSTGPTPSPSRPCTSGATRRSAFAVGQARGVVLLAAGQAGVPCVDYTPQQVKGAVCGTGRADKDAGRPDGPGAPVAARARRAPTTPPTRWPSPSATPTTRRSPPRCRCPRDRARRRRASPSAARATSCSRPPAAWATASPCRPRRCARSRPSGDAASRCWPTSSCATTRCRSTASRRRRSATSSCCSSASSPSGRRWRSPSSAAAAPRDLVAALAAGDAARLQAVPGIGKRTAERIVVELREKVVPALGDPDADAVAGGAGAGTVDADDPRRLARDGLLELGYAPRRGRPPPRGRRRRDARGAPGQDALRRRAGA